MRRQTSKIPTHQELESDVLDPRIPQLLTVVEVAAMLRLCPSTVYAWAASGRLPCIRIGTAVRFDRGDVLRWLRHQRGEV
jgi:excisionase family DNA binding protein